MTNFAIEELVPHTGKMVLLDRVIEYDEENMVAEAIVRDDGLFGDGRTVPAWLGIEYMAQTIAALGGMKRRLAGKPLNLGFLLGTRRYDCNVGTFTVGSVLTVSVKRLLQDQGLGVFECRISAKGILASAKLNVYQPDSVINRVIKTNENNAQ
ncbi:MAG: ApeP family dehydratase [Gammaproteobacteria bacterium]